VNSRLFDAALGTGLHVNPDYSRIESSASEVVNICEHHDVVANTELAGRSFTLFVELRHGQKLVLSPPGLSLYP
jgi:hypothetical protein